MVRAWVLVAGLLFSACRSNAQDPPRPAATGALAPATPDAQAPAPKSARAQLAPTHLAPAPSSGAPRSVGAPNPHRFEITAVQAKKRGLAPRRIALDLGTFGWSASAVDEPGRYFHLSGPPGGPLGLELREQPPRSEQALLAAIRAAHPVDDQDVSAIGTLQIGGQPWRAVAFLTGQGFSRSLHWVADRDGLTLHAFIAWRTAPLPPDAVARLLTTRPFDHVLGTLEIEPQVSSR